MRRLRYYLRVAWLDIRHGWRGKPKRTGDYMAAVVSHEVSAIDVLPLRWDGEYRWFWDGDDGPVSVGPVIAWWPLADKEPKT